MTGSKRLHSLVVGVFLSLSLLFSPVSQAADITLEEVIKTGLEKNDDLRKLKEKIIGLQRELALIRAEQDWQVELGANYNHYSEEDGYVRDTSSDRTQSEKNAQLSVSKSFPFGLTLQPGITVTEEETGLSLKITQPLIPLAPTELQKQYFRTAKDLLKAKENLEQLKAEKINSWLESYLNICRMMEKKDVYEKSRHRAETNLHNVLAKQEINEAGPGEILSAQAGLKNAEYLLQDINYKISEARSSLLLEFGVESGTGLAFSTESPFLNKFEPYTKKLAEEYRQNPNLVSLVKQSNYDLLVNQIDQEVLKQEVVWLKKKNRIGLDLTGSYNSDDWNQDFTVGLSFTYKLHDGGAHRLQLEDKEAELQSKQADYQVLLKTLDLELKQLVNTINLLRMEQEKERLNWKNNKYQSEVAVKQWKMGLITYQEYQEYKLSSEEAEVSLRTLEDRLFLERINLIKAVNIREITGGFNHD